MHWKLHCMSTVMSTYQDKQQTRGSTLQRKARETWQEGSMRKRIVSSGEQTHTILQALVKAHESIHHSLNLCIGQLPQSHTVLQSKEQTFGLQPHTCTVRCPQQQHDACSRASSQEAQQTGVSGGFFNAVQMHMLSMRAAEVELVCHLQVMQILWFGRTDSSKRSCLDNGVRMRPAVNKPGRPVVGVQL